MYTLFICNINVILRIYISVKTYLFNIISFSEKGIMGNISQKTTIKRSNKGIATILILILVISFSLPLDIAYSFDKNQVSGELQTDGVYSDELQNSKENVIEILNNFEVFAIDAEPEIDPEVINAFGLQNLSNSGFEIIEVKVTDLLDPNFAYDSDINSDGAINSLDLSALFSGYGSKLGKPGYSIDLDITKDGYINSADLNMILSSWGSFEKKIIRKELQMYNESTQSELVVQIDMEYDQFDNMIKETITSTCTQIQINPSFNDAKDLNNDGSIDGADLNYILSNFGQYVTDLSHNKKADIDGSGKIDFLDLKQLFSDWGKQKEWEVIVLTSEAIIDYNTLGEKIKSRVEITTPNTFAMIILEEANVITIIDKFSFKVVSLDVSTLGILESSERDTALDPEYDFYLWVNEASSMMDDLSVISDIYGLGKEKQLIDSLSTKILDSVDEQSNNRLNSIDYISEIKTQMERFYAEVHDANLELSAFILELSEDEINSIKFNDTLDHLSEMLMFKAFEYLMQKAEWIAGGAYGHYKPELPKPWFQNEYELNMYMTGRQVGVESLYMTPLFQMPEISLPGSNFEEMPKGDIADIANVLLKDIGHNVESFFDNLIAENIENAESTLADIKKLNDDRFVKLREDHGPIIFTGFYPLDPPKQDPDFENMEWEFSVALSGATGYTDVSWGKGREYYNSPVGYPGLNGLNHMIKMVATIDDKTYTKYRTISADISNELAQCFISQGPRVTGTTFTIGFYKRLEDTHTHHYEPSGYDCPHRNSLKLYVDNHPDFDKNVALTGLKINEIGYSNLYPKYEVEGLIPGYQYRWDYQVNGTGYHLKGTFIAPEGNIPDEISVELTSNFMMDNSGLSATFNINDIKSSRSLWGFDPEMEFQLLDSDGNEVLGNNGSPLTITSELLIKSEYSLNPYAEVSINIADTSNIAIDEEYTILAKASVGMMPVVIAEYSFNPEYAQLNVNITNDLNSGLTKKVIVNIENLIDDDSTATVSLTITGAYYTGANIFSQEQQATSTNDAEFVLPVLNYGVYYDFTYNITTSTGRNSTVTKRQRGFYYAPPVLTFIRNYVNTFQSRYSITGIIAGYNPTRHRAVLTLHSFTKGKDKVMGLPINPSTGDVIFSYLTQYRSDEYYLSASITIYDSELGIQLTPTFTYNLKY